MSKTVIDLEKERFILENYMFLPSRKIAEKINVSKTAVLSFLKRKNIQVPMEIVSKWKSSDRRKAVTEIENTYIIANIINHSIKKIALDLGRSNITINRQVHVLGLTEIIEFKKLNSRIQLGNIPPNKGKKLDEFMKPETLKKFKENQYKKKHIPHNAIPDGVEVIKMDAGGRIYIWIKVLGRRKLILKHRYVWECHHKKSVPKGYNIIFKDRDTLNLEIENLDCISDRELMLKNSIINYPEDLKEVLYLKGAVTKKINKINKNDNRNSD